MAQPNVQYMINHVIKGKVFIRLDDLDPDGKPWEMQVGEIELPITVNMAPYIPDQHGL